MPVRRLIAATSALTLAAAGYLTLDIADVAPGWLTRQQPVTAPSPTVTVTAAGSTSTVAMPIAADPTAPLPRPSGQAPTRAGLTKALAGPLAAPGLGPAVGMVVRDGTTGEVLFDKDAATPRTPASTVKLLTAAAITSTVDPDLRLRTRVVQDPAAPGRIVLVAGGDMMLGAGASDPHSIPGRAGLDTLARQVATGLGRGASVTLGVDTTFAAGPGYPTTWSPTFVPGGIAAVVGNLGLASQLADPGTPLPDDPVAEVTRTFAAALRTHGITVAEATPRVTAPRTATQLGVVESAPLTDVLSVAMQRSDNAMTEELARIAFAVARGDLGAAAKAESEGEDEAAVRAPASTATSASTAATGEPGPATSAAGPVQVTLPPVGPAITFPQTAGWVRTTAAAAGYDVRGVQLVDTCGLSKGSMLPVSLLGDLLVKATQAGPDAPMHRLVTELPVAGLTGTLAERYTGTTAAGAGLVRAKTGTLTGTSGLAGTVVDRSGRLLDFAIVASAVPPEQGTLAARAALDTVAGTLAGCGCTG